MKVVILAGGRGSRLSEETHLRPKPMVEIGDRPILWHIMKHYAHYGFEEFYLALGYRGDFIKRYFIDYYTVNSSLTVDLATGKTEPHERRAENWRVHLIDTGLDANTGGRTKFLEPFLRDETFMLTYGDGLANIDLHALVDFHKSHGKIATVSAVRPPARFGGLALEGTYVTRFSEKPQAGEGWINGGFAVFEPGIFDYLAGPQTSLEAETLEKVAAEGELVAYRHDGFWQCMDTLRDKHLLEALWADGSPPWKVWRD